MEMFPELPKIDEGYKIHLSKCGDSFHEVTTFGDGTTFNTTWKHDVETPFLDFTFLTTKIPGGNKIIIKNKAGKVQEYTIKFTEGGFLENMVDHDTGKTGLIEFVRFVDFSGEFKPIANVGGADIAVAMGWPVETYQKILSDPTTRMIIKESGCQYVLDFKSDNTPKEVTPVPATFKLGEEFEWTNPFDPTDKLKMVATAKDNVLLVAGKGKVSITGKYIFTENFVIREMVILGTGLAEKIIFIRC
jgi:hypothetical protein